MEKATLTQNQELYCQARMRGLTQRAAYREAYPRSRSWKDETVDKRASELETRNGVVMGRLEALKAEAASRAIGDRAEIIRANFMAMRKAAGEVGKASDLSRAPVAARLLSATSRDLMEWLPRDAPDEGAEPAADFAMLLGRDFCDMHRWVSQHRYSEYWLPGGRGSLKTSTVFLEVMWGVATVPGRNAVCMRNRTNKLRTSVYAEAKRAASRLGVLDDFEWTVSPMRAVHRGNGNAVHFFGADNADPQDSQLKGFAPEHGYVAYLVLEEASQFPGYAYVRSLKQTVLRGSELPTWTFLSYNPPRSARSWVNVECDVSAPGRVKVPSCYLEAPPEWLGGAFLEQADDLRERDPRAYEHEYLGVPVGSGTEVFDRVVFREVTDGEIAAFDNLRCGQDFGWHPDPWAFTMSEWRPGSMTLVTFAERGGCKLTPSDQAREIEAALTWPDSPGAQPAYHHLPVLSDDAEPSTIAQQRDAGANARAAGKGGMRSASYRFLQAVTWVVDPARCPNLAREVREMEHDVTRDGEVLESIPDGNDHWVDATRYAMMAEARSRYAYRGDT